MLHFVLFLDACFYNAISCLNKVPNSYKKELLNTTENPKESKSNVFSHPAEVN